jgi:hypothetical protein
LAQPLVSRIGASPLWRAGLASIFILGLAGFAAGVIPQACRSGVVICQAGGPAAGDLTADVLAPLDTTSAPAAPVETSEPEPAPAEPETAVAAIDTSMRAREPAALTRNDLIAQTFAALDLGLTTTPGELTARKVRTIEIGPDGMPVLPPADTQVAAAPGASAEPAPQPVELEVAEIEEPVRVEPAPPEPSTASSEEEPTATAYAPVRGGNAIVGRQGANVRTLPQTSGSEVLYALASGEEVTIMETTKGWSKIVDSRGRSGWVWGELLRR